MNTQVRDYSDVAAVRPLDASNKNISSVLSQIQDDGPAYSEVKKRDNLVKLKMENKLNLNNGASNDLQDKDLYTGESLLGSANFGKSANDKKKTWFQYIVVLFLIVCVMFFMYQMDDRANKLEAILSNYDEDIQDTVDFYNQESSVIIQLNADLASMKKELELISPNTNVEIKKMKTNSHIDIQDEIVSSLEDEIQILKIQLDKVNNDLKIQLSKSEPLTVENNDTKTIKFEKQLATFWKVNLAALKNKNRVDEVVTQLKSDGLKPSIDEVTVNGQLIYRLSVGGFPRFSQAELFVITAEKEYGMKGGWIEKASNG
ncbi:hypothetical protein MNBD_GAMMA05-1527 [hydrothermal vent metagenome]|uniref:SPOR domain-containing protein n=1 Tax=hydrothermal vent metagenome TaxID=652676 RepID=A0A3B0XDQ8_9ZZZZ